MKTQECQKRAKRRRHKEKEYIKVQSRLMTMIQDLPFIDSRSALGKMCADYGIDPLRRKVIKHRL